MDFGIYALAIYAPGPRSPINRGRAEVLGKLQDVTATRGNHEIVTRVRRRESVRPCIPSPCTCIRTSYTTEPPAPAQVVSPSLSTMPQPRQSTSSDVLTTIPAESTLFPEVLGFTPHFLHDDIFNVVGETVNFAVNAMNENLDRWATARAARCPDEEWDGAEEIEQGLVAFQTLLDSHVDGAFDFFEIWSLRNIFSVQVGLPLVVPHQAGLDLKQPAEKETALLAEIEDLRRKLDTVRSVPLLCACLGCERE